MRSFLLILMPAIVWGSAGCEVRPVPAVFGGPLQALAEMRNDSSGGPSVGLQLPDDRTFTVSGEISIRSNALAALLDATPLRVDASDVGKSRRAIASKAAARLMEQLDELVEESGPLTQTVRRWSAGDPDRRLVRIAADLERMAPWIGWRAGTLGFFTLFTEVSTFADISPLELKPLIRTFILADSKRIPIAVAIQQPDSGGMKVWMVGRSGPRLEVVRRIAFQGNSRVDFYAVCGE